MIILYGIPNCDKVRVAKKWLTQQPLAFDFFNFKTQNLTLDIINNWFKYLSWQDILNQGSTTWRGLDSEQKNNINQTNAIKLMQTQPTIIKRPVLQFNQQILVGFKPEQYLQIFNKQV